MNDGVAVQLKLYIRLQSNPWTEFMLRKNYEGEKKMKITLVGLLFLRLDPNYHFKFGLKIKYLKENHWSSSCTKSKGILWSCLEPATKEDPESWWPAQSNGEPTRKLGMGTKCNHEITHTLALAPITLGENFDITIQIHRNSSKRKEAWPTETKRWTCN